MNHDDAKQKALEHAAWLHFEDTQTFLTVEAAIEEYRRNFDAGNGNTGGGGNGGGTDPGNGGGNGGGGKKPFRVFDAIRWGDKPNLEPIGLEPIKFYYASSFFDPVPSRADKNFDPPKNGVVEQIARSAPPGLVVGDVEHMWPGNGLAMDPRGIDAFIEMTERFQAAKRDNTKFGWYSSIPRNYHDASEDYEHEDYRRWRRDVDKSIPIINASDFLTLSLYTFYEDVDGWEKYARRNIEAGLDVSGGKPAFGVIWPLYHDSSDRKYQLIEREYIEVQLEVMLDAGLDGVIIWTRSKERQLPWGDGPPFYKALVPFMKRIRAAA